MSVTVFVTQARSSLPGGSPWVELPRFFVKSFQFSRVIFSFHIPWEFSPCRTRSRTSGQENTAHYQDPHDADDERDEPRIGAVWCPKSTARPRGAAQQGKHNGCDPRREERVRDQPGPPEPKRRGHDKHRARERSQHEACPYEVVQARCEQVISRGGDGVRQGRDQRDEQEEKRSEGGTGGGRRRAPTVLSRIRQGGPERPREPHEIEDSQAVKHGRDQNPHAVAVVEGCQCVGRCADLRLMAVDDVRDYEAEDRLDAGCPPQAFPERGGCVDAGGGSRACGCAHEDLLSKIGCDARQYSRTDY